MPTPRPLGSRKNQSPFRSSRYCARGYRDDSQETKARIECPDVAQTNEYKPVHPIMSFPPVKKPARTEGVSPYVRLNTLDNLKPTSHRSYHFFKNQHLNIILCNGRRNVEPNEPSGELKYVARYFLPFTPRGTDGRRNASILPQPTWPGIQPYANR